MLQHKREFEKIDRKVELFRDSIQIVLTLIALVTIIHLM
jgi:hypothetical protein